jgi:hypothetical protein
MFAEGTGERESAGAPQERPVEVEKRSSLHESSLRARHPHKILTDCLPAAALETSEFSVGDL